MSICQSFSVLNEEFQKTEVKPFQGEMKLMEEPDHKYQFVCAENDVDYVRIVREAPTKTPFIIVEERNRFQNRAKHWVLLVHNDILSHPNLQHHILITEEIYEFWGDDTLPDGRKLFSYRFQDGLGKFPREFLQDIEHLKKLMSSKDTLTLVEYK